MLQRVNAFAGSSTLTSNPHYRPDIDGLRAIAVGGVVAFHAAPGRLSGGFVGVDVFFVISGYLISSIILAELHEGAFSFIDFYRRRVRRILPALVVVIATTWTLGLFALWPNQFADLGTHILAASTFTSNFLLALQAGYFDKAAAAKPLLHLWSLAIEEQFYLVWPAVLYLAWKTRLNIKVLLYVIVAASFALAVASPLSPTAWSFYGPQNRAWELGLGALLALHRDIKVLPWRFMLAAIGIILIALSMLWLDGQNPYPGWRALAPTIGTALLILAGPHTSINRVLSTRALVSIGLISYPLYLWHWPLLSFAHIAGTKSRLVVVAIIIASLMLAYLTYCLIELPIRRAGSTLLKRYAASYLLACLGVAAILGAGTRATNGLAVRYDGALKELADYHFDEYTAYRGGDVRCMLAPEDDASAFSKNCIEDVGAPLLVLWGDSHAAHLYPGLKALENPSTFSLAQFTASACPPILGVDVAVRPHCRSTNGFILSRIASLKPRAVMLAASWWESPNEFAPTQVSRTISSLKKIGVERIILLGPVPVWNPSLPLLLFKFYKENGAVPKRMNLGVTRMTDIDNALRKLSASEGITYFSALEALCNLNGCITRTGKNMSDLTAWDSAHLTTTGSRYLVSLMPLRAWMRREAGASLH